MKHEHIDDGHEFDWGLTSGDYARFRPGYPEEFYDLLTALGVGRPGQRVLDLGTGTGVLARAFARRGAQVTAVDISVQQISAAREIAAGEDVDVDFRVSPAEQIEFPAGSFDVISAGQSWLYFDAETMVGKVLSFLTPDGRLVLTHLLWLPGKDRIARASEELVLEHNPHWSAAGYEGVLPTMFPWAEDHFDLMGFHVLERPLEFTRETWRGRFRACRGVGASLSPEQIAAFDAEHDELLRDLAGDRFEVWHQMTVHMLVRKGLLG
jgi:SAM-dependent methyltransferase